MMEQVEHPLSTEVRADIVTARETINRAVAGNADTDLASAAALLDRVLESTCPHDPERRFRALDASGRELVTCFACNVSWYE